MDRWLVSYRCGDASRYHRGAVVRLHINGDDLGNIPIGRLQYAHVQDWIDRKAASYSPNYVRELVNPLRMALATAVKRNIIAANPCDGIELPRVSRSTWSVLTEEEARRLITGTAADRYHALWVLAVTLGIRRGELLALRWSDIDLDRRTITIQRTITRDASGHWIVGHMPKTESSRRTIRIPERCLTALRHHRTRQLERRLAAGGAWLDTGAVFDRGLGEHWENGTSLWREFIATLDRLGLPRIRQHDLRHTAASHMLCAGIPVSTVSKILGHANPSITYRLYAHVIDEMHEEAVDRIDMMYEATGS